MTTLERLKIDLTWLESNMRAQAGSPNIVINLRSANALLLSMRESIAELEGSAPTATHVPVIEHPGVPIDPQSAAMVAVREQAENKMNEATGMMKSITVGLNPTATPGGATP